MGSFWHLVIEATLPVLKICLLGAVGAGMARAGILDQSGRRTLSKLIYCLFTPALTFTKLAPVLSGAHLVAWMPLVINMFVSVGAGLVLGGLLLAVVRPPAGLKRHVVVATALGNAGNLPLVLVAALVRETGGKLFGEQVLSEDLAIAYVAMGIWAATITHFTIGTELLKLTPEEQEQQQQQQLGDGADQDQQVPLGAAGSKLKNSSSSSGVHVPGSTTADAACCVVELGRVTTSAQHPQQQQQQQQQAEQQEQDHHSAGLSAVQRERSSSQYSLRSEHGSADCLVLAAPVADSSKCSCISCGTDMPLAAAGTAWHCPLCGTTNLGLQQQQWRNSTQDVQAQEHAHLLAPSGGPDSSDSTWLLSQQQQQQGLGSQRVSSSSSNGSSRSSSSMWRRVGQVAWNAVCQMGSPPMVGCILAVVVGLIRPLRDLMFAPQGQLLMLQDCISMFGDCCIPCLLLMLGATLSKGPGKACPPLRVVAGVAAARLVLLPLLGTGWLVLAKMLGWYHAPDKMFVLVMLIQNAVPTALNVHTLATLHNNKEAEMGAMLFWQYLAACITLPAALSFFLWLLNTPAMNMA